MFSGCSLVQHPVDLRDADGDLSGFRHQVFLGCDAKLLLEGSDKVTRVGVANLVGNFSHLKLHGVQQHAGAIQLVVEEEAEHRISINFFKACFQLIFI